jgi:predicted transposase/invertase (TIGR01784 family)
MESKFLDPRNDFAFKKIFGTPNHKDILIHFLNDMIDFKDNAIIKDVEFLKTVRDPEIAYAKQSIVDVLCSDEQGRKYIVEMQVANTDAFVKRAQYYAAKAYCCQINQGDSYHNLKEIIFLAITNFVMFPEKIEYKSDHVILDKNSHAHDLKDFYFCFLELPKFKKELHELSTHIEKWAYFFKHAAHTSEADVKELTQQDPIIGQAFEALNQFSWSQEELNTYEQTLKKERDAKAILDFQRAEGLAEGIQKGLAEGIQKGLAEGSKQAALKIAQKLLSAGMDLNQVESITGLSRQEFAHL